MNLKGSLPTFFICLFVFNVYGQSPYGPHPCTLNLYTGSHIKVGKTPGCYDDQNACIDWSFRFAMDLLNKWAGQCDVDVYVCRSFVRTMAGGSYHNPKNVINNEVGHGVDIRLRSNKDHTIHSDWAIDNNGADCFMKKLNAEKTLHWEMSFDGGVTGQVQGMGEAIHVDDRKYQDNRSYWKFLHSRLYTYCQFL